MSAMETTEGKLMHILVALPYATQNDRTMASVASLLRDMRASATLAHVVDLGRLERYGDPSLFQAPGDLTGHAEKVVGDLVEAAAGHDAFDGIEVRAQSVASEHPVEAMLELADNESADLIMVPVVEQSTGDALDAGFAASILRRSERPIVVVPR